MKSLDPGDLRSGALTGRGNFWVLFFAAKIREDEPILTYIFFKGVETTN